MLWALGGVTLTRVDWKKNEYLLHSTTVAVFASNNNTNLGPSVARMA